MKIKSKKQAKTNTITTIKPKQIPEEYWERFKKYNIQTNEKVLIAVSGWSDSMLTAYLIYIFFIKNKYNVQNLFFIHCNHKTRPENKTEEKHIQTFFENTNLIITRRKKALGTTETELRMWRYKEFNKYIKKHKIHYLATGHNLTDRIESTFLHLLRGANINGFIAMQEKEPHHLLWKTEIIRPILTLTKDEVLHLCKKNKIPFVTDPTNKNTTTSLRNKLRNEVLPKLYQLANKQNTTTNSFIESMKNIYTTREQKKTNKNTMETQWTMHPIKKSIHRKAKFAYKREINTKDITNQNILQNMKKLHISNNITTAWLEEIRVFLTTKESGYKYINTTYFFKSHRHIYIISAPKEFRKKTIDSSKKINTTNKRFPQKEDKYKGKTRNKWCINQKIPIFRRNFIPVFAQGNQIIKHTNTKSFIS